MCSNCLTSDGRNYGIALIDQATQVLVNKKETIPYEADMLSLVYEGWIEAKERGLKEALAYINAVAGTMESADIMAVLDILEGEFGEKMSAPMRAELTSLFERSYQNGKVAGLSRAGLEATFGLVDEQAVAWLTEHHLYWIGSYYDRQVSGSIAKATIEGLNQGLGRKEIGGMLGDLFEHYPGVSTKPAQYWEGLAANAMNRSRNFGLTGGFQEAGFEKYQWLSVMDESTSPICRELNGTIFTVAGAVTQRNRLMEATNPEQVKEIAPWPSAEDIEGRTSMELTAMGVSMPPVHFR